MTKSPDMADDWKRLSEMKEKYGASFARKIEDVFNDTVESKSLMDHFKKVSSFVENNNLCFVSFF